MCSSGGHLLSLPGWLATVCFSMVRCSAYFVYSFIQSHRVSKEKANSFQIDPDNSGPYIPESITTENNNPGPRCICIVYTVLQFNYVFIENSKTRPTWCFTYCTDVMVSKFEECYFAGLHISENIQVSNKPSANHQTNLIYINNFICRQQQ